jgi:hypothetical protein
LSRRPPWIFLLPTAGLWSRRRHEKPQLELAQSLGAFPRPGGDISPLFIFFTVANVGESDTTIAELRVESKGGSPVPFGKLKGEKYLPYTLTSGEETRFWVRAKELARALKDEGYNGRPRVKLVVVGASGDRYEKRFRFRVDEYLELKDE